MGAAERAAVLISAGLTILAACDQGSAPKAVPATNEPVLRFIRDGREQRTLSRTALVGAVTPVKLELVDPYYAARKRFSALPLVAVLELGMNAKQSELSSGEWTLRAADGYAVVIEGARLFEDGAYLAIEDLDFPAWEPIGPRRANPGPFYLIWSRPEQQDVKTHPRPWQLASIELGPPNAAYPNTVPTGADEIATRGYAIFKAQCIRCHMINREGGTVGPELNVPMNVLEYRDREYLRRFIKNPWQFRYGAMPPMPLSDRELDEVLAYFEAMRERKSDKDAGKWTVSP